MTVPLALLADFIEKLTEPRFGLATNETYAARLTTELDADPEFAAEFANYALRPADVPALSLGGWLWYLAWRRQRSYRPPDGGFLDALYDSSAEPIVRFQVVLESVRHPSVTAALRDNSSKVPASWLTNRIGRLTDSHESEAGAAVAEAQELALYLIQLGDPVSRAALASLLRERWLGQGSLIELVGSVLGALGPEDPAQEEWRRDLGLSDRPTDDQ